MKKLSDQLSALAEHTKKTEDTVDAARQKNQAKLTAQRDALTAAATAAKEHAASVKGDVDAKWDAAHSAVDQRFAAIRDNAEQRRAAHDLKSAERHADDAEQDASDAIDLALYVLDQAEYAIADAVIARADADALALS